MAIKENDFVEIEFDIYANEKLVETTNEKKAKDANLEAKENRFGPKTMIIGKSFILEALDKEIIEKSEVGKEANLELTPEKAFGKRDKKMIKVLSKSAFDEHKLRPVVGGVYDFNGMYGTVKSIIGGRIMVDFNSPLAGKDIKITYKVNSIVEDIVKKIECVFEEVLRLPKEMFKAQVKDKEILLKMPAEVMTLKEQITKTLEEYIVELKDYSIKIENFKKQ